MGSEKGALKYVHHTVTIVEVKAGDAKIEALVRDKGEEMIFSCAKGFFVHFLTKHFYFRGAPLFIPFGNDDIYILNKAISYLFEGSIVVHGADKSNLLGR
jgi:hypothetical protein